MLSRIVRRCFAGGPPKDGKIPKVADSIVWLNVVDQAGMKHVVPGTEGHSILKTLRDNNVYMPGSCKGGDLQVKEIEPMADPARYGPTCSECQVIFTDEYYAQLKPIGQWEYFRLLRNKHSVMTERTRLGCCIRVEKWMNGMFLLLPYVHSGIPEGSTDFEIRLGNERLLEN